MKTWIDAKTITEAWQQLLALAMDHGYRQDIQRGSFAGDAYRLQLPFVAGTIEYPLQDMIPMTRPGIPPVCTTESVEQYFAEYLVGTRLPAANEVYTYATRIQDQLQTVMDMLAATPDTNQASIIVGRPEDVTLGDPACLRALDFKAHGGALHLCSFWRSHDAWAGFPTNLGGLAMLLAYVAEYAGLEVGTLYYSSHGTHLYSYQLELANGQIGR